ncbi:MAG: hypothetical protein U0168_28460 [Nannocystaceae bacterium]
MGYEIRRFIAFDLHATGLLQRYDDGAPRRELLGQGVYTGELRLGVPFRRFMIAAHGGGGVVQQSNNLLQIAGVAADNRRFGVARMPRSRSTSTASTATCRAASSPRSWACRCAARHAVAAAVLPLHPLRPRGPARGRARAQK